MPTSTTVTVPDAPAFAHKGSIQRECAALARRRLAIFWDMNANICGEYRRGTARVPTNLPHRASARRGERARRASRRSLASHS